MHRLRQLVGVEDAIGELRGDLFDFVIQIDRLLRRKCDLVLLELGTQLVAVVNEGLSGEKLTCALDIHDKIVHFAVFKIRITIINCLASELVNIGASVDDEYERVGSLLERALVSLVLQDDFVALHVRAV